MVAPIVQNDAGTVADANAYIDVAFFKAYHDARGNSYAGMTDDQIGSGIVRATDYIDGRWAFVGIQLVTDGTQTTQWPRQASVQVVLPWWDTGFVLPISIDPPPTFTPILGPSGNQLTGIPKPLKNATAEYALRALSQPLFQDAPAPEGGRMIHEQSVEVDVIKQTIIYEGAQGTGAFQMPAFPTADMMLSRAGMIQTGRQIYR